MGCDQEWGWGCDVGCGTEESENSGCVDLWTCSLGDVWSQGGVNWKVCVEMERYGLSTWDSGMWATRAWALWDAGMRGHRDVINKHHLIFVQKIKNTIFCSVQKSKDKAQAHSLMPFMPAGM